METNFEIKIKPKIGLTQDLTDQNIIIKKITILLFSLRFIFGLLLNKKSDNNPIYNLLTKQLSSIITFIPYNINEEDLENLLKKKNKKNYLYIVTYYISFIFILCEYSRIFKR